MARGQDAVEPPPGLARFDPVGQYFRWRRHFGPTLDESMQALKALVIFLGVLIVIGMGVLAYGIMMKFDEWRAREDDAAAPTPVVEAASSVAAPAAPEVWAGDVKVAVPAGARVAETVVADGRLILRLSLAGGGQRYLIFDLATGRRIGAIELQPDGGGQ